MIVKPYTQKLVCCYVIVRNSFLESYIAYAFSNDKLIKSITFAN